MARPGAAAWALSAIRRSRAIEEIVTAFTEAKLAQADDSTAQGSPGDSATSVVHVVIDAEAPRRFRDHDSEPRPPTAN